MAPIEIWRPNQQLRWIERTSSGQPAAVEFNLESRGGKTIVRLVQCGFDGDSDWDNEWYDSCNYGWEFMLVNLRHYLERHAAQPRLVAWPRKKIALPRKAIFDRLVGAQGLFSEGTLESLPAGQRYSLRAATGEPLRGCVEFVLPPRGFCVTIEDLNEALFWLSIEGAAPPHEAGLWLSSYGLAQAEVDAFGARWSEVLEGIFTGETLK